jgi:hypothetical protein
LAAASRQANVNYKLAWEPFLLNPNMDDAGEDMRAHLTGKYGPRGAKMLDDPNSGLMVSGRAVGIAFNNNRKMYPTVKVSDLFVRRKWIVLSMVLLAHTCRSLTHFIHLILPSCATLLLHQGPRLDGTSQGNR